MKVIGIVGLKNSGKTFFAQKIISALTSREFEVASIKHAHDGFETTAATGGPRAITVDVSAVLSSIKEASLPKEFALYNNYPNPFNPVTNIAFDLPEASEVVLEIYNISGQRVRTLVNKQYQAGRHMVQWSATNDFGQSVASGMYLYRIQAGSFVSHKKLVLMK